MLGLQAQEGHLAHRAPVLGPMACLPQPQQLKVSSSLPPHGAQGPFGVRRPFPSRLTATLTSWPCI